MDSTEHIAPTTIVEAVSWLADPSRAVRPVGGCADLLCWLYHDMHTFDVALCLPNLAELHDVRYCEDQGLTVGAAASWLGLAGHCAVAENYPSLAVVATLVAEATLYHCRSSYGTAIPTARKDALPLLVALGALCCIQGPEGRRSAPIEDVYGPQRCKALEPGELLVSVNLPVPPRCAGTWYIPFYPDPQMRLVYGRVAAALVMDEQFDRISDARVVLGLDAKVPLLCDTIAAVLINQAPTEAVLNTVAALARVAASDLADSDREREQAAVVGHMARLAVRIAVARADLTARPASVPEEMVVKG